MSIAIRKKKLADGSVSLYLDIYQHGKRQYEFLNLYLTKERLSSKETLLLARSIAAQRQLEIQNSEHGFIPQFKKKANFVQYFERLTSDKPHRSWKSTLKILREFTNGQIQFSAISGEWLEELKRFILTKVSQNSGHLYFQKIKTALNQAVKDNILLNNPSQHVPQIKMQETHRVFLTIDEIQKLAATACRHPDVRRAFLFCCYTGLRFSDVKALTWANIRDDSIDFRQQKTQGMEYLPLPAVAQKILYMKRGAQVLPVQTNKIFSLPDQSTTGEHLKKWCKEAGMTKRITFHTSRHTFATLALSQGADLYTVSKLLGHKDISTTQIYAKIVDQKKKDAVALLPDIEVG